MKGIERGLSYHHVVLCNLRLVRAWIKRREVVDEKLKEHQYREGYAKSLEGKRAKWGGKNNVEHM